MNKLLAAVALSIALPALAHAQTVPAPAPKAGCCEKMKDKDCCKDGKMDCCKDMAKMDHEKHDMKSGADPHAGHDISGAKAPQADGHQNH
ncbi:MAG: alanine and proline-rich secreted protein Apa [Pseudomonadota bacterium]|nr:alanine and proline-rich secreted protein Apa [Pseudomonadota bacterium]